MGGHSSFYIELGIYNLYSSIERIVIYSHVSEEKELKWYVGPKANLTTLFFIFSIFNTFLLYMGFPGGTVIRNLPAKAGDTRDVCSIPGSGRSPGIGNGNPLQDSCSMDREAWRS